ncbi:hypothetical protein PENTCL1PPCAC_26730, partial [Pristionchus entomophagus]
QPAFGSWGHECLRQLLVLRGPWVRLPSSAHHLLVGAERVSSHGCLHLIVGVVGPCHPFCCWGLGSTTDCPASRLVCSESVPTDSG